MDVVLAMTIDAGGRSLAIGRIRAMAARARHRDMGIQQGEIGQIVREAGLAQLVDISLAAQVLGMAAATLTGGSLRHPAVIAGSGADVSGDFLVTVETECRLAFAVGAIVAVAAFTFDLGVGL